MKPVYRIMTVPTMWAFAFHFTTGWFADRTGRYGCVNHGATTTIYKQVGWK